MKNLRYKLMIVALLAVVAIILLMQNSKGTLSREIGDFAIHDTTAVTRIYLADMRGNEVLLTKVQPGIWTLNDTLSARIESVNRLLSSMFRMAVQSPVSRASYNNVITTLATNSVKVEVYEYLPRINIFNLVKLFYREKLSKVFYVGEPTSDNQGTFMLMEGSDTPFIVYLPGLRGFLSARFSANPNDWRNHTIFAISPHEIRSIRMEFPLTPEESYLIEKFDRNDLKITRLADNQAITSFDMNRVMNFINGYRNIRFESIVEKSPGINRDSIIRSVPQHIITLTDTAGVEQRIKTFRRQNFSYLLDDEYDPYPWDMDRFYGLVNDEKDFVLLQYFVFDPVTRPLSYFVE